MLTPQILFNSEIEPNALGHYLCEQPLAFCQIVLKQDIVDDLCSTWKAKVDAYCNENPDDPIPIPMDDPTPQVAVKITCLLHVYALCMSYCIPKMVFVYRAIVILSNMLTL